MLKNNSPGGFWGQEIQIYCPFVNRTNGCKDTAILFSVNSTCLFLKWKSQKSVKK